MKKAGLTAARPRARGHTEALARARRRVGRTQKAGVVGARALTDAQPRAKSAKPREKKIAPGSHPLCRDHSSDSYLLI